jgi:hypothetical protein
LTGIYAFSLVVENTNIYNIQDEFAENNFKKLQFKEINKKLNDIILDDGTNLYEKLMGYDTKVDKNLSEDDTLLNKKLSILLIKSDYMYYFYTKYFQEYPYNDDDQYDGQIRFKNPKYPINCLDDDTKIDKLINIIKTKDNTMNINNLYNILINACNPNKTKESIKKILKLHYTGFSVLTDDLKKDKEICKIYLDTIISTSQNGFISSDKSPINILNDDDIIINDLVCFALVYSIIIINN